MNNFDGKKVKDWSKYLFRRLIVVEDTCLGSSVEVRVLEISPSKKYVKFELPSGYKDWRAVSRWLIIEELESDEED